MIIPDPALMSWDVWAAAVVGYNPALANQLAASQDWHDFGAALTFWVPSTPRPDFFDDWQSWASALKLAVGA